MRILLMVAALLLTLAACSGQGSSQSSTSGDHGQKSAQDHGTSNKQTQKPQGSKDKKSGENQKQANKQKKNKQDNQIQKKVQPKYEVTKNYDVKPIGDADPKVVLLTIDDAPDEHAVEMAKTLKNMHAKAIFFIMGTFLKSEEGKEKLKKIHDMGFMVGNHTVTHPTLSEISKKKQREEIVPVYKEIKEITGEPAKFFRAPHGINTDVSAQLAKERGVLPMNWSYGYDWHQQYEDPKALTDIMLKPDPPGLLHNGAILLMHDRVWTAKALPNIVKGLRKKGYKFVDPAELKTPEAS